MNRVARAIRANELRRTRFHTERGELMPARAWLGIPSAIRTRVMQRQETGPWMIPAAIKFLERAIEPGWQVLELGAGASTPWYAARAAHVIAFEHDPRWAASVRDKLARAGHENARLRELQLDEFPAALTEVADATIDLAVVDSDELQRGDRLESMRAAAPKVRPGGYLVLDDSDRREYRHADELLPGWSVRRFVGLKGFPMMAAETSVYRRPEG